ncbi:MAG: hypothetical protein V1720_09030 [bacterium]
MQKVVDNEFATVIVHPEKKIVQHKFHKFIHGDVFRTTLMAGRDAFIKNRCTKWLSDDRNNTVLKQEDLEWGQKNWEAALFKAGWKHWALVLPEKAIGQLSMKKLVEHYTSLGLKVETFSDPDAAMKWLEKQ